MSLAENLRRGEATDYRVIETKVNGKCPKMDLGGAKYIKTTYKVTGGSGRQPRKVVITNFYQPPNTPTPPPPSWAAAETLPSDLITTQSPSRVIRIAESITPSTAALPPRSRCCTTVLFV